MPRTRVRCSDFAARGRLFRIRPPDGGLQSMEPTSAGQRFLGRRAKACFATAFYDMRDWGSNMLRNCRHRRGAISTRWQAPMWGVRPLGPPCLLRVAQAASEAETCHSGFSSVAAQQLSQLRHGGVTTRAISHLDQAVRALWEACVGRSETGSPLRQADRGR